MVDSNILINELKDINLLLVDDNKVNLLATELLLKKYFHTVYTANDGVEALEVFIGDKESIDLVITDIEMPKMNGLELANKIKEDDFQMPIILLTGHSKEESLLQSYTIGISDYIIKPLNKEKLFESMQKLVKNITEKKINEFNKESLLNTLDKNVIVSKTDLEGIITYTSSAFCKISGFSKEELIGQPHKIVRHPDMPTEVFKYMWEQIESNKTWVGEIKNLHKEGHSYWVESTIKPDYDYKGNKIGYVSIREDIGLRKEIEILNNSLELKVEQRTKELEKTKKEVENILSNILLPILVISKEDKKIIYANRYAERQYSVSTNDIIGKSVDDIYMLSSSESIFEKINSFDMVENIEDEFITFHGKVFKALLSLIPTFYYDQECYICMVADITKQKDMEQEIRRMHKHTKDSIEYAAIIQSSLVPENKVFRKYFQDYFVIWHPKDIVGGDVYLFSELRDKKECLLMCIDCTGHGVPGAFITMLVKAIEAQLISDIYNNPDMVISTSEIMGYFNRNIKKLLKQDEDTSISNVGLDGIILYYNKEEKIIKYSGAESPLFYRTNDGEIITVKGTRQSVGYKKCPSNYKYDETVIKVEEGMKFYLTTDWFIDQNGGEKGFPFGKRRLLQLIENYGAEPMAEQQEMFIYEHAEYEEMIPQNDRNDDITVIGLTL